MVRGTILGCIYPVNVGVLGIPWEFPGNFNVPQMFPWNYTRTYVPGQIHGIGEFPGNSREDATKLASGISPVWLK